VPDWSSLTVVPATVTRVVGTLVSLRYPNTSTYQREPFESLTTVRWPAGVPVSVGREITAGCYTDPPYMNSRIVVAIEVDGQRYWVDEQAIRSYAPPEPVLTRPAFLPVLVAAGLLDNEDIDPKYYGATPVGVLMTHYEPKGAMSRGFLHFDHRWPNWTRNPIRDLAKLTGRTDIRSVRARAHDLVFELGGTRYTVTEPGALATAVDRWLEHIAAPTRLFRWDTRVDAYAFLARPLADGLELARKLDDAGLEPAATPWKYPAKGDPDYF
jgi:hypothetical protein